MRHLTLRLRINSMVADLFLEINNQLHVRSGQLNLTKMAASDSICAASLLWPDALAVCRSTGVYLLDFFCSGIQFNLLLSPYPCFISLLYLDLYVLGDDALIS